jgi:hypothetical protein
MTKAARKEKNQRIASAMKAAGIERTTGRCCICNRLYNANFLREGFASHRCQLTMRSGTRIAG